MTGFGAGRAADEARTIAVELRSVNSKSFDLRLKLPRDLVVFEPQVQAVLRERIQRGRVDLVVELSAADGSVLEPRVDLAAARGYLRAAERLKVELGIAGSISLEQILSAPGVLSAPVTAGEDERAGVVLNRAVGQAIDQLEAMRIQEGASLSAELLRIEGEISARVRAIHAGQPELLALRKSRFEGRVAELLGDQQIDPIRLAQELALLIERSDVTEELARLESHLSQLGALMAKDEPVGRRLDFLIQEMHREVNTIGAKSASARVAHLVVDLKSSLEQMREQVQNVE